MSEKVAYRKFRLAIYDPKKGDRIDRIENIMIVGMPDVNCCIEGCESWMEIKSPTEPKRSTTPLFGSNHKVSQDQKNWFLRQRNAGGRAYLLITTDKRWMLIGSKIDFVNEMTIEELVSISLYNFELDSNGRVPKNKVLGMREILTY